MLEAEYKAIIDTLKKKLKQGQLTKEDQGYNKGIQSAISVIRSQYKNQYTK